MIWSTIQSPFFTSMVEFVKAISLVLVVGLTVNWKSSWLVVGTAILTLTVMVAIFSSSLVLVIPIEALRIIIGLILLIVFFAFKKLKPITDSNCKIYSFDKEKKVK
ncbi:MAG TPA: hypothetical protein VN456_14790, partial [Desulfosporosinus sp.]|nr:hypothetical protein [Desulfosporosinus sp.]